MQKRIIKHKEYIGSKVNNDERVNLHLSCGHIITLYKRVNGHDYRIAKYQIIHPCNECGTCYYNKTGELS